MDCESAHADRFATISADHSCRIFLIFFVNSLQQQISNNVVAYVTSDFGEHPLTSTTNVVSGLVAGVIKLPVAKLMDIFGRIYGFILMVSCTVIGKFSPLPDYFPMVLTSCSQAWS